MLNVFYLLEDEVVLEPLNRIPHIQVNNTAFHQARVPASAPDATAAGNTIGMTCGHIQYTIVPPRNAARNITTNPSKMPPKTTPKLSIICFLV